MRDKRGRSGKVEMSGEWQEVEGRGQVEGGTAVEVGARWRVGIGEWGSGVGRGEEVAGRLKG